MSVLESARDHYLDRFERFRADLPAEPAWLAKLRAEAIGAFAERGLPHTRLEEWRYTNVAPIAKVAFELPDAAGARVSRDQVEAVAAPVFACSVFVFVDGRYAPEISTFRALTGGVRVESLAQTLSQAEGGLAEHFGRLADGKQHAFAALNTAFAADGAVLDLPAHTVVDDPVHVVFLSTQRSQPSICHPRVLVRAGAGSRGTLLVDHVSLGTSPRFTNAVIEVSIEDGAALDLVLIQREAEEAFHVSNLSVRQARDSRFSAHTLTFGGSIVRNDVNALLLGEGAECSLRGLFVGHRGEVLDNHTAIDHAMPRGRSDELYKGVLGGNARGVFRGRVIVRPDAQHTDARQSNPNLLLGEGAEVNTKPQLEIHADDVRCSHGSSIGRPDEDALFYLRSRGIGQREARALWTRGFAAEILRGLPVPALAEGLTDVLDAALRAAGEDENP